MTNRQQHSWWRLRARTSLSWRCDYRYIYITIAPGDYNIVKPKLQLMNHRWCHSCLISKGACLWRTWISPWPSLMERTIFTKVADHSKGVEYVFVGRVPPGHLSIVWSRPPLLDAVVMWRGMSRISRWWWRWLWYQWCAFLWPVTITSSEKNKGD